ncbi:MAG TPA: HAD family hydrolase [Verrucomicrobiae bacterium]|nr:HAD family hydrolase [Verrucomicrobiae bacterium]
MSTPIKLISTDFDGTLFAEFESPPIPPELLRLIGQLREQGAKWVINTGREMSSLMESLARAGVEVEPDYLVLVEREIHRHDRSLYLPLEDWNAACTRTHADLFAVIEPSLPRLIASINQRFHASIYEDAYSPLCLIARDNEQMDGIHAQLDEFCQSFPNLTVVRNDVYARFSHRDYNKGSALGEIARRLGIPSAQVLAVGDHLNDLPMLSRQYAAFLAAPSNAIPLVKETVRRAGGYLSPHPHGHGVADAIKYYAAPAGR